MFSMYYYKKLSMKSEKKSMTKTNFKLEEHAKVSAVETLKTENYLVFE